MFRLLTAIALAVWPSLAQTQPSQSAQPITMANEKVDAFIATIHPQRVQPRAVEQKLKSMLSPLYFDGQHPSVYVTDHPQHGRYLVAVYTLSRGFMGAGGTAVKLRTYKVSGGRFTLAAVSGNNMDGYANVAVRKLPSPKEGELWLLLWGNMTGANGPNIRMRVFATDGIEFRPMWMPENSWGAFKVTVTPRGFTVVGEYYKETKVRRDAYFVAEDGLYRQHH